MYIRLTILLMLSCFYSSAWAEKIYKCQDAKGILIYGSSPCKTDIQTLNSWTVTTKVKQPEILILKQNDFGQYSTEGAINELPVNFVVDTGATRVSLPTTVAQAAQIMCKNEVTIHTANGSTQACAITIPKFKFGPFSLDNVEAIIAPNLSQPLLGMNVLQQFKIAQELGEMHISKRF